MVLHSSNSTHQSTHACLQQITIVKNKQTESCCALSDAFYRLQNQRRQTVTATFENDGIGLHLKSYVVQMGKRQNLERSFSHSYLHHIAAHMYLPEKFMNGVIFDFEPLQKAFFGPNHSIFPQLSSFRTQRLSRQPNLSALQRYVRSCYSTFQRSSAAPALVQIIKTVGDQPQPQTSLPQSAT